MGIPTRCLVVEPPGRIRVGEYDQRDPRPGEVAVEVALSGVSPGTELRSLAGRQDDDPSPFVPGYAAVGTVVAGDEQWIGRRVFAGGSAETGPWRRLWGGHQGRAVRPAGGVVEVPDGVSFEDACLAKLAAIALHGVRLVPEVAGRDVAVVGLGAIGQFSARCFQAAGANVAATDREPARMAAAEAGGVKAFVAADRPLREAFADAFPDGPDVVVDATGSPRAVAGCVDLARALPWDDSDLARRPVYVVQGSHAGDFTLPYLPAFRRELTFVLPRDNATADLGDALAMMADGSLSTAGMLGGTVDPADAADAYRRLADPSGGAVTLAFDWRR